MAETQAPGAASGALAVNAYLQAALDCVLVADASGCIVEFNPAAERTFGYSREEALGRRLSELIVPPGLRDPHTDAFARFAASGEGRLLGRRLELTGMRADGSEFPVELTLSRVEGEPLLVCGALRDLTDAKRTEEDLRRHAAEHAALRHVATSIAEGGSTAEVFAAVAEGVADLLGVSAISMIRFERDGTATKVAGWGESPFVVGTRWALDDPSVMASVAKTGCPARIDDYATIPGRQAELVLGTGIRSAVGVPITVGGDSWGVLIAFSIDPYQLSQDAEERLARFTGLIAIAVANAQARDDLRASEELYRTVITQTGAVAYQYDYSQDRYVFIDDGIAALTGYSADEFTPDRWGEMVNETILLGEQAGLTNDEAVRRTRSGEFPRWRSEQRVTARSGETRWISDASVEILGPDGISVGAMGMLHDITEWKRAEEQASRLADEQAALRRVATLVASESPPDRVFGEMAESAARLLNVPMIAMIRLESDGTSTSIASWGEAYPFPPGTRFPPHPGLIHEVRTTGRAARVDSYADMPDEYAAVLTAKGIHSGVGVPIILDGKTWGLVAAGTKTDAPLSPEIEARLSDFTQLLATAMANEQARDDLHRLAREQAALRRVATSVAEGSTPNEVFAAVAEEVARLLDVPAISMVRFEQDETSTAIAVWGSENPFGVGATFEPWPGVMLQVRQTGRSARLEDFAYSTGPTTARLLAAHIHSGVGVPITVEGRVWGTIIALAPGGDSLPIGVAERLSRFTDLVATAIANAEARDELDQLADQQAALRRVATLVAGEASPDEVFAVVAKEVAEVLALPAISMVRYEPDGTATEIAGWWREVENPHPIGRRWTLDYPSIMSGVAETGRPVRIDDYATFPGPASRIATSSGIKAGVGVPIVVDGQTWGLMNALATDPTPLPPDIETRLSEFTELVATAISNAQARNDLRGLADEQAALRRVAVLVAEGAGSPAVYDAICQETGPVIGATSVNLCHFTADRFNLTVAGWSIHDTHVPTGTRLPIEGGTINELVHESGAPARIESYAGAQGALADLIRERGIKSEVAAPVIVDGRLWGTLVAGWHTDGAPPTGAERRLAGFAELVATAVSNALTRSELVASRARIVTAADEARRKIERNLHDGIQQQLVSLQLELKAVDAGVPRELQQTHDDVKRVHGLLENILDDVREIAQGVHPATLSQWGLGPALRTLARRSPIPVELELEVPDRLPQSVEIAVYYVVSEALANVAKHAQATHAAVTVSVGDGWLRTLIRDDGVGGAGRAGGSGIAGLVDRVEALGGQLSLASAPQQGTTVTAALPLDDRSADRL